MRAFFRKPRRRSAGARRGRQVQLTQKAYGSVKFTFWDAVEDFGAVAEATRARVLHFADAIVRGWSARACSSYCCSYTGAALADEGAIGIMMVDSPPHQPQKKRKSIISRKNTVTL